jgi:protein TonB
VFENRFLQSFCAVAASAVLVGGTLILLTSTAPWSPPQQIDSEPSTPDSARLSPQQDDAIDAQFPGASLASDQADTTPAAEPNEADRTYTASTDKQPDEERSQLVEPEAPAPEGDDTLAALGMPLNADTIDTDSEAVGGDTVIALDAAAASEGTADNETPAEVAFSEPAAPVASDKSDAATDQIADLMTTLPPRVVASDKSDAATDQIADVLAALRPAPQASVASDKSNAATVEVAAVLAATKPAPAAVAVVAPPPPLPKRKPAEGPPAPKVAALPAPQREKPAKPAETKPESVQQEVAQPRGDAVPWKPMALAPADKPSIALSKAPTARPSGSAYASKVWSALARHKPKAGQHGSTTVVFAIGGSGALRGLRVGRSSGNTRLDKLALATVRNAAPFPPPPSGAASYTIRIDFH